MQVRDGQAGPFWSSYPRQPGTGLGEGPKQFNKEATQAPRLRLVIMGPQLGLCQGRACSMGRAEGEPRPESERSGGCRSSAQRAGQSGVWLQLPAVPCEALPAPAGCGGEGVTALTLH